MSSDGEILLTMDGNAKVGLMGENVSRNGKMLLQLIDNMNLTMMNKSNKCKGRVTRKNTKNGNEMSAIDYVIASEMTEKWITDIQIDEDGLLKVKGKNETDHNTISIHLHIKSIDHAKIKKRTGWNINAPTEKWSEYALKLRQEKEKATKTLMDKSKPIDTRYKQWYEIIEKSARESIGKTTYKNGKKKRNPRKK